jgi:hypothetical protein
LIGNVELLGSVQVIGGNEMPGRETFTPELIVFPPMIVGPMLTEMGPTLGGTNVSNPDPGACAMEGGLVAALAPLTGAAMPNRPRAAAAADNLRMSTFLLASQMSWGAPGDWLVVRRPPVLGASSGGRVGAAGGGNREAERGAAVEHRPSEGAADGHTTRAAR